MDDRAKMLGLMRYWLFGTFIIIWTAMTVYVGAAIGTGIAILGHPNYWIAVVVSGVLCVAAYYVYRWWLDRSV